jgi:arabinose-5-phosphate isomerase
MLSINEVMLKEAYTIIVNAKSITNEFETVIDLLVQSAKDNNIIFVGGVGKNRIIAEKMAATLTSLSIRTVYFSAFEIPHGDLGLILKNQVVIVFSKSGNTKELSEAFFQCGERGAKLVAITCNKENKLKELTDKYNGIHISLSCDMEADEHDIVPSNSSTLFISVADAIGLVASSRLKLTKEQFYSNHRGGSLGAQLKQELGK